VHPDDRDGLRAYRFETFPADRVDTLVSTRDGGVSQGSYASLNLGLHVRDADADVVTNRERFFAAFGQPLAASVWCLQIHADAVHVVGETDLGRGARSLEGVIADTDALVTDRPGVPLCVLLADCVPVALYDPEHHAIGLAHAGWKGTVARISSRTVEVMREAYGSDPAQLIAGIGPSISPDRYEVGENVIAPAREAYGDAPVLRDLGGGKALFDLWAANALDLEQAGVPRARIEISGISTIDSLDEFYSHRFEGSPATHTGRFATVVTLA
jgi:YfiH family protein